MNNLGLLIVFLVVFGFVILALSGKDKASQTKTKKRHDKPPTVSPGPDKSTVFVHYPGSRYAVAMKRSDAIAAGLIKSEPSKKRNFWKVYS